MPPSASPFLLVSSCLPFQGALLQLAVTPGPWQVLTRPLCMPAHATSHYKDLVSTASGLGLARVTLVTFGKGSDAWWVWRPALLTPPETCAVLSVLMQLRLKPGRLLGMFPGTVPQCLHARPSLIPGDTGLPGAGRT